MVSELLDRLSTIRSQRPWPQNPVYRSILSGTLLAVEFLDVMAARGDEGEVETEFIPCGERF